MSSDVRVGLCTCPDMAVAGAIARALVDEGLAACVSMLPGVTSVYRWQGEVEQASEVQLLIKTTPARWDALVARLVTLHPYDVPELLGLDAVGGLPGYLHWVTDSTRPPDPT